MLRQAAGAESVFRNTFFGKQLEKKLESAHVIGGCFRQKSISEDPPQAGRPLAESPDLLKSP